MNDNFWRRCSTCKRYLGFGTDYYACSVSTCNRKGNAFVFCSVSCWEVHVPTMRHRESWAEQQRAPSAQEWAAAKQGGSGESAPRSAAAPAAIIRKPDGTSMSAAGGTATNPRGGAQRSGVGVLGTLNGDDLPNDILIVASKLKAYIRARSGMNTSENVMAALSVQVRKLCDNAILRAREDERKTVMDRDF